eukprot:352356-Chlamydomonas_euryale.AAC.2
MHGHSAARSLLAQAPRPPVRRLLRARRRAHITECPPSATPVISPRHRIRRRLPGRCSHPLLATVLTSPQQLRESDTAFDLPPAGPSRARPNTPAAASERRPARQAGEREGEASAAAPAARGALGWADCAGSTAPEPCSDSRACSKLSAQRLPGSAAPQSVPCLHLQPVHAERLVTGQAARQGLSAEAGHHRASRQTGSECRGWPPPGKPPDRVCVPRLATTGQAARQGLSAEAGHRRTAAGLHAGSRCVCEGCSTFAEKKLSR